MIHKKIVNVLQVNAIIFTLCALVLRSVLNLQHRFIVHGGTHRPHSVTGVA